MNLNIIQIEGPEDEMFIEEFAHLRDRVREEKFKIGGAGPDQIKALMRWGLKNRANFWLVKDHRGKAFLRICARVSPHLISHGTLGLFELDLNHKDAHEGFSLALQSTLAWLQSKGVKEVTAPVDLNTWFTYRFSLEGKHFWPRLKWEPTTPPEYLQLFREKGFKDIALFHSVFFPHYRIGSWCLGTGAMRRSLKSLHRQGFKLRPFDKDRFMTHEVPVFHNISHEAFGDSLFFEPIDLETFSNLYAVALKSYDFSPSSVLISPDGETAGFIFAFYDDEYLVIKSIAIKKKYQGRNLSSGMIYHAVKQSFAYNKKGTISALVRTGIASESIEKNVKKTLWFSWAHYYTLLQKEF